MRHPVLLALVCSSVCVLLMAILAGTIWLRTPPQAAAPRPTPSPPRVPSGYPITAEEALETPSLDTSDAPGPLRGVIRGHVFLEAAPAPAPGARVAAVLDGTHELAGVATADALGAYKIPELSPGRYAVCAWRNGWAMAPLPYGAEIVDVTSARRAEGVDRVLIPGGCVTGRVVSKAAGEPITGAQVDAGTAFGETDATGAFRLEGVRFGLQFVHARAAGFVGSRAQADVLTGDLASLVFELEPGGALEGRVILAGGAAAPGARVGLRALDAFFETVSGSEGRYLLDGVPWDAEELYVTASLDGGYQTMATVTGFPEGESHLTLDLELELEPVVLLAGRVIDAQRKAIAGAALYSSSSDWHTLACTDAQGRFEITGVSASEFMLTAQAEGFDPASVKVKDLATAAERETIELMLQPSHWIAGRVVDEQGQPIERAWVAVDRLADHAGPYPNMLTDAEGRFRLGGVEPIFGGLAVQKPGYREARGIHSEADGKEVVIELEEAGQIEARVVENVSGREIPTFMVKLLLAQDAFRKTEGKRWLSHYDRELDITGHAGRFRVKSELAPGVFYKLIVSAPGFAETVVEEVEAWPATATRDPVRIELERGARFVGRVVSETTGRPIQGVSVTYVANHQGERDSDEVPRSTQWFDVPSTSKWTVKRTSTSESGGFELEGVSDQPAVLLFAKRGFARRAVEGVKPAPTRQEFSLAAGAAVEGRVQSGDGSPFPGATISICIAGQWFPRVWTDRHGKYRLADLPAGDAEIHFNTPCPGKSSLIRRIRVTLQPGETASGDLTVATGSIAGRVTRRGVGVAGVNMMLTLSTGESDRFQTDPQGRYCVRGVPPDTCRVGVEDYGDGFSRQGYGFERTVEVGVGEVPCDIELAAMLITGRVVHGRTREPVAGAHVSLYGSESWPVAQATCAPGDNRFELEVPGAGTYNLTVATKPGDTGTGWLGPITFEEGVGLREVIMPLGGLGGISVTVQEAVTEERLQGAAVRVAVGDGSFFQASAVSGVDGTAWLDDLSPGRYRIEAETDEHVVTAAEVVLVDAAVATTLVLERASSIVVEVRGDLQDRKPVRLEVRVLGGGDPGWTRKLLCGTPKAPDLAQIVLKARSGDYHLRFVVLAHGRRNLDDPKNTVSELDVRVPESGSGAAVVQISTE